MSGSGPLGVLSVGQAPGPSIQKPSKTQTFIQDHNQGSLRDAEITEADCEIGNTHAHFTLETG
jgi:hypothetical protein